MSVVAHQAKWVLVSPDKILENCFVTVEEGWIKAVGTRKPLSCERFVDHGSGVLMPAAVNAHTHLDLSCLQGKLPFKKGFTAWVKEIIAQKQGLSEEGINQGIAGGCKALQASGCALAGDHRSFPFMPLCEEPPLIMIFREYLGGTLPFVADNHHTINTGWAAHAPHTTAPALILKLKQMTEAGRAGIFSIHVAESSEEVEFIGSGGGLWAEFLRERKIDFKSWRLPAVSPVKYLDRLGALDENTLVIHLTQAERDDFRILRERQVRVCLCPRSNANLVGRLPDIPGLLREGIRPALGTDSLASVDSLSIFDEMAFVARHFPSIRPGNIIAMGTINGAESLGMGKIYGSLKAGKRAALNYVSVDASSSKEVPSVILAANCIKSVEV